MSEQSPTYMEPYVLIVDIESSNFSALEECLQGMPLKSMRASTSTDALSLSLRYDFSVVLLNTQIPGIDSFELAKLLRAQIETQSIPIVFVAEKINEQDHMFKGYESGAVDYIFQPIDQLVLQKKIQFYIDVYKTKQALINEVQRRSHAESEMTRIVESIQEGILSLDNDGSIKFANIAALALLGEELDKIKGDLLVEHLHLFFQGKKLSLSDLINLAVSEKEPVKIQKGTRLENIYGKRFMVVGVLNGIIEQDGSVNGVVLIIRNIADDMKLERALIQAEKVKSLGQLLSGVAQEIRNPLGTMMQGGQNIARRLDTNLPVNIKLAKELGTDIETINAYAQQRKINDFISGIRSAGGQAAKLISSLLQLSEETTNTKMQSNMIAIVDEALSLIQREHNLSTEVNFEQVRVNKNFQKNLQPLSCSATEITQVIYNILKNSASAMKDMTREPEVSITIEEEKDCISVIIADNGCGMDEDTAKHAFDPFFTTKPIGEGTGLGLTVSYSIIEHNHDGNISLISTLDKGTEVKVTLPIAII